MDEALMSRFPAVSFLEARARRRIPHFAWEYLHSGTGSDACVARNRDALNDVALMPQFMKGELSPDIRTELFGVPYAAPFGVAPVGLTGLMWPRAEQILAEAAGRHQIPYGLSTVATEAPETIGPLTRGMGWFQLYPPRSAEIRQDLLARAKAAGFTTLLITVDVPTGSRRERQVRAGVSVPPKITPLSIFRAAIRPAWSVATLQTGLPRFRGLERYADSTDMAKMAEFVGSKLGGTLDWNYVQAVRDEWDGPIVLKGVLDANEARYAVDAGVDGIGVSNHGGRQFDGAPAAITALPAIVKAVGDRATIIFDSGVRTGLDVARAIALGADFVLCGRAFMFGVTALGPRGGEHVIEILKADLINNMAQIGCATLDELKERLP
ncbi:MAG: alpha-hydroxy-acid oxidizing protein [Gammaproteobacteria bacterium]|nr:alpha-hydroxy-acid oxidizing protein [Gammaproteobacteria bacterium]